MVQEVFNHSDYLVDVETARFWNKNTGKELRQAHTWNGYLTVCINKKRMKVHRLVLQTVTQSTGNGKQVNHKDGNKENNCYTNLEWCTCQENIRHSEENGLNPHRNLVVRKDRKLSDEEVNLIRKYIRDGFTGKQICEKVANANYKVIYAIKHNLSYMNVKDDTEITE